MGPRTDPLKKKSLWGGIQGTQKVLTSICESLKNIERVHFSPTNDGLGSVDRVLHVSAAREAVVWTLAGSLRQSPTSSGPTDPSWTPSFLGRPNHVETGHVPRAVPPGVDSRVEDFWGWFCTRPDRTFIGRPRAKQLTRRDSSNREKPKRPFFPSRVFRYQKKEIPPSPSLISCQSNAVSLTWCVSLPSL